MNSSTDISELELLSVTDRETWRAWLKGNHGKVHEVWLVYFKKASGRTGINYAESVEEAICFGWIDGLKKSIDKERYAHRFSPRKAKSRWTVLNIQRARAMIEQGLMTNAGLAAFENREEYGDEFEQLKQSGNVSIPNEIKAALKQNSTAWKNFQALAPGYRKQYILWLTTAKRADTRARRLERAIDMLEKNQKPGML
jgi:uncharacterized protein YdeI (YjbR/CyaY-like superfamily)